MTVKTYTEEDTSLITLLDLNGEIFPMDNGWWTKIEAYRVEPNQNIPHGIRYSLTLHDRYNKRIKDLTTHTLTDRREKNTEHVKSHGIINTDRKKYRRMNMNRQLSCWKISGRRLNRLYEK